MSPIPPNQLADRLRDAVKKMNSVLVALSGGVDSSVLAAIATQALGERAAAATGISASFPAADLAPVRRFCRDQGLRHFTVETHELDIPDYVANTPSRCFFCKDELFGALTRLARERALAVVLDGTTADDLLGHRPGAAAAEAHQVRSPFAELGVTKEAVRELAHFLGLSVADRPSSPCLSSRIAYGVSVTPARLQRISAAEQRLKTLGFANLRVRLHDPIARIEVPVSDLPRIVAHAAKINTALRELGFTYVTVDLGGLRSGSLLDVVEPRPK